MKNIFELTEYDSYDIYSYKNTHIAFSRGFAKGGDFGIHNKFNTNVLVLLWESTKNGMQNINDPGCTQYSGFDVSPAEGNPENGYDWDEYENIVNKSLNEVYEYLCSKNVIKRATER